jgi:NhaA family Na+:H+ antiporter
MLREKPSRSALRAFLDSEAIGGMLLILAAAAAVIVANSRYDEMYRDLLHWPLGPSLTPGHGRLTVHDWINDGLMAVFFLLVGLEIKREWVDGRLSTWEQRRLPIVAAASGMVFPALTYLIVVAGHRPLTNGWAIPAATDIAFAIGVLALLGSRAPISLKLFLTTVAIVDDMGAVAIIALAYTAGINTVALGAAALLLLVMYIMGKSGVARLWPYLLLAAGLWYAILLSGVHATIAGVLAATVIPILSTPGMPDSGRSPLHRLEHGLAPITAFAIVPIFGFANAGVTLGRDGLTSLVEPLPLAIAAGLFLGKQIGIFGAVWIMVRTGLAKPLRGATWLQIYGVCLLCGIGFTMSLFIGALAFPATPELVEEAKIGILAGSLLSAAAGYVVLRLAPRHARHVEIEDQVQREIDRDGDVAAVEEVRG